MNGARIAKTMLMKKKKLEGIILPNLSLIYNFIEQDSVVLTEEQTRLINETEMRTRNRSTKLIFDKGAKAVQWRKNNLFNKWCQNNWTLYAKKQTKKPLDLNLIPY